MLEKQKPCGVKSMGQGEDFGDHPCMFAGNEEGGFTKDVVAFQES